MAWTATPQITSIIPYVGSPQSLIAGLGTAGQITIGPGVDAALSVITPASAGHVSITHDQQAAFLVLGLDDLTPGSTVTATLRLTISGQPSADYNVTWTVQQAAQHQGWHDGGHYLLPLNEDGTVEITPGILHRKVYCSSNGKTANDIATELSVDVEIGRAHV